MINTALLQLLLSSIQTSVGYRNDTSLGLIILAIVEMPVLILILASIFGRPRRARVTGLFLGWVLAMFAVFVASIWIIGFILGLFF